MMIRVSYPVFYESECSILLRAQRIPALIFSVICRSNRGVSPKIVKTQLWSPLSSSIFTILLFHGQVLLLPPPGLILRKRDRQAS